MEKHRSKESLVNKARQEVSAESVGSRMQTRKKKDDLRQIIEEDSCKPSSRIKAPMTKRRALRPQQLFETGFENTVSPRQLSRNLKPYARRNELLEQQSQDTSTHQSTRQLPYLHA
jgi:hypothetical protein